jgi:2-phospho-L-lactate guanylyltransferase
MDDAVTAVIFCKPLAQAKRRLAGRFAPPDRAALVRAMLTDVIAAAWAAPAIGPVLLCTRDAELGAFGRHRGAEWLPDPGDEDLNRAAQAARQAACARGVRALLLLPADLPCVTGEDLDRLARLGPAAGVRARDGGTNALLIDPRAPFDFRFGPHSFEAHGAAVRRRGQRLQCLLGGGLVDDLDTPQMVDRLAAARVAPHTAAFLAQARHPVGRVA